MQNPYSGPPVFYVPIPMVPASDYERLLFQWYQGHAMFHVVKQHNDALVEKCNALSDEKHELERQNMELCSENDKLRSGFSADGSHDQIIQINRLKSECREYRLHIRQLVLDRNALREQAKKQPRKLTDTDEEIVFEMKPAVKAQTLTLVEPETVFEITPVIRTLTLSDTESGVIFESKVHRKKEPSTTHQSTQTMPHKKMSRKEVCVADVKSEATQTTDLGHAVLDAWARFVQGMTQHEDDTPILVEAKRRRKKVKQVDMTRYPVSLPVPTPVKPTVEMDSLKIQQFKAPSSLLEIKAKFEQKQMSIVDDELENLELKLDTTVQEDEPKLKLDTTVQEDEPMPELEPKNDALDAAKMKKKQRDTKKKTNKFVRELLQETVEAAMDEAETKAKTAKSNPKPKKPTPAKRAQMKKEQLATSKFVRGLVQGLVDAAVNKAELAKRHALEREELFNLSRQVEEDFDLFFNRRAVLHGPYMS